jgi:hypothetical protein
MRYARPSDYAAGAGVAAIAPITMLVMEKVQPSMVGKGGFPSIMRLTGAIGISAGFLFMYQRSTCAFPISGEGKIKFEVGSEILILRSAILRLHRKQTGG